MYLIGKENVMKTLKNITAILNSKHPTPNDIKRSAERISGANLDLVLLIGHKLQTPLITH
jgi:hypothetical protein